MLLPPRAPLLKHRVLLVPVVLEQAVRVLALALEQEPRALGPQQGLAPLPEQPQRRALPARLLGLGLQLPLRRALRR